MNDNVDFLSVMIDLGLAKRKRPTGNYHCPFCNKDSFTIYPDQKAYCHTCEWSGDVLKFYQDTKQVSKEQAYKELGVAFGQNKVKLKSQTYQEAKLALAKDLEFLAWFRMYEGFYDKPDKIDRKMLADKAGISVGKLSKVINGQIGNPVSFRKTLAALRTSIPLEQFKKDLALKEKYFERIIDDEKMGEVVKKYQIK